MLEMTKEQLQRGVKSTTMLERGACGLGRVRWTTVSNCTLKGSGALLDIQAAKGYHPCGYGGCSIETVTKDPQSGSYVTVWSHSASCE